MTTSSGVIVHGVGSQYTISAGQTDFDDSVSDNGQIAINGGGTAIDTTIASAGLGHRCRRRRQFDNLSRRRAIHR